MPTEKTLNRIFYEMLCSSSGEDKLVDAILWMQQNLEPEDIFSEKQLSNWAEANGYTKE